MFKNIIFITIVFLLSNSLKAQQLIPLDEENYLRQISYEIKTNKHEKIRLENFLLLSEYWSQMDSIKSKEALHYVLYSPNKNILSDGILDYYQGVFYFNRDKLKSKLFFQKAIKSLEHDSKNIDFLIKSIYNNAYIQIEDKGYDFFVKTMTEKYIPLAEKYKNNELLAYGYTQLGLSFMSVGQFDTAEEYHNKALEQLKNIPYPSIFHLITYYNLVSNYCYKPDSLSAKIYLNKAKNIIQKYSNSQHFPNYYYQEAMYYTTKQDYNKALISLKKGVNLALDKRQYKLLHMLYFRMYNVYLMQKDYNNAKLQLEEILKENILSKEPLNRRITFTQLASVNEIIGDYKQAYDWMKKSNTLGDSLQQNKLIEKMNEFDVLYQTSEKQKKIDKLELEKKENELIAKNRSLRIIFLVIGLVLSIIIACLVFINYKKQEKLNKQISKIHEQKIRHIEDERKYEATKAILQGEEQERQRIAQDLHDSIGSMLANIRMSLSSEYEFNDILNKIDKSISEMRRISRNLMPETLKNLGLEIAIKELCDSMINKNLNIQFEAFNIIEKKISFDKQLALYRITQEGISNIIKYAQANNVIIQISQNNHILNLTIEDDGIGFEKSEVIYGLGLENMANRVKLINGRIDIVSFRGQGVTINIECNV